MTNRQVLSLCAGSFVLGAALMMAGGATGDEGAKRDAGAVYELRTYTTHPGKLPALHQRFRDHTLGLFEKHGMKNVMYWTPTDDELKDNTLIYVVAHKSREAADKSWAAFRNDPVWQAAYKESHKDGPIVMKVESRYMTTTDYSPGK